MSQFQGFDIVILAAGKATRLGEIANKTPKPLSYICGKSLLYRTLEIVEQLQPQNIFIVVPKSVDWSWCIPNDLEADVHFITQEKPLGTGHAISLLNGLIKNPFLLLFGDSLYSKKDLSLLHQLFSIDDKTISVLLHRTNSNNIPSMSCAIWNDKKLKDYIIGVIDKPSASEIESNDVPIAFFLPKEATSEKATLKNRLEEFDAYSIISKLFKKNWKGLPVHSNYWIHISYPEDLYYANFYLAPLYYSSHQEYISNSSSIKKSVIIKNSIVGNNTQINADLKNCLVLPGATVDSQASNSILWETKKYIIEKNEAY